MTGALILAPEVSTEPIVSARIWIALGFSGTSWDSVYLFHGPSDAVFKVLLGDLHGVDSDVLDATSEGWRVVGQDLLIPDDAAEEGVEEHCVVLSGRIDGLSCLEAIVDAKSEVRAVHGHVDLDPVGVVQVLANDDALVLGNEIGMQIQLSLSQLKAEMGVALSDGDEAVAKCGPKRKSW